MRKFSELILELSFDAKTIIWSIRGLANPILNHLFKYYMFPESSHKDHWIHELKTWFLEIAEMDVKPRRRKLSKETYFKILFEEFLEDISDHTKKIRINRLLEQYPNDKTNIKVEDFDAIRDKLREFFKEISLMLSTNTYDGDIKSLLEKHLNRQ